jgi:uncharacterized membrane protein YidH (DUF202 family)
MSTHSMDDATVPVPTQVAGRMAGVWRGLLVGLIPLGLLAAVVGIALLLTAFAHQLFEGAGFFAQQQAALIVLIAGLTLAIAVFAVAIWRVLRRVAAWQQSGAMAQASATLWVLSATALIVVLPVLLALLLPQHPAP